MTNPIPVDIRESGGRFVRVSVVGRERPSSTDYNDGNWLVCEISAKTDSFSADFRCSLRTEEFVDFQHAIESLTTDAPAVFKTMEEQLEIRVSSTPLGMFHVSVVLRTRDAQRGLMQLEVDVDSPTMDKAIRSLNQCISAYPVVGQASS